MSASEASKNHHWWPVGLQYYWTDNQGDVWWIEPNDSIHHKRSANRKVGYKIHGHTFLRDSPWKTNFEGEFDIDNEVPNLVKTLQSLKGIGARPSDFGYLLKLLLKRDRKLSDLCRFYDLDETVHRNLLLLIFSLLFRSPASRSRYENYPVSLGLPPNEDVGKANMRQYYRMAKKLCQEGLISNQYFVLIRSPFKKFICGDGYLDWLSGNVNLNRIDGRALVPLTPHLCIFFCTPRIMRRSPNFAAFNAAPWIVDWINDLTQIYSKDKLFFHGQPPKLTEAFREGKFFTLKKRSDALIEMLDEIAGIKPVANPIAFTAFS